MTIRFEGTEKERMSFSQMKDLKEYIIFVFKKD